MRVLTLASQKGGAGKTTLAAHLAVAAQQAGIGPVAIIDLDPQGSLTTWAAQREDGPALAAALPRDLVQRLDDLRAAGVALVVIDTPPALGAPAREAMRVADLTIIPVRPSPHDLAAVGATIDIATGAGAAFVFVVTQAKMQARVTPQAVASLSAHGVVAEAIIQDRVSYAASMIGGHVVGDLAPKGHAAAEIAALWTFVKERIKEKDEGTKGRSRAKTAA
jgi:chromosome partitioning protein